jgi:hypothetical protein
MVWCTLWLQKLHHTSRPVVPKTTVGMALIFKVVGHFGTIPKKTQKLTLCSPIFLVLGGEIYFVLVIFPKITFHLISIGLKVIVKFQNFSASHSYVATFKQLLCMVFTSLSSYVTRELVTITLTFWTQPNC